MTSIVTPRFTNPSFFSPHYSPRSFTVRPSAATQITVNSTEPLLQSPSDKKPGVIVIGAGLAGLAAATRLTSENIPFLLVEASDSVGGRVRTDIVDGFLLDRGFQIFITAYPEARKLLDYDSLDLQKFYSGAFVYYNGQFHTVADPIRHFWDSVGSLTNPIGSVFDKLRIGLTRLQVLGKSDEEILNAEEVPTIALLRGLGFSDSVLDRFFRPFFGGIFFDPSLETTSRLFNFIFKCLALGNNTLPTRGIGAIPEQLASRLPSDSILFNKRVASIHLGGSDSSPIVTLESGEVLRSEFGVVVAVEEPEATKLLSLEPDSRKPARSTVCLYFSCEGDSVPFQEPVLFLNGSGKGIVNNMFFATNVAPSYGPLGKALVSVSLIGLYEGMSDEELTGQVVDELAGWFGVATVSSWKHLRTYRVGFAQPNQSPPTDLMKNPRTAPGLYLCGDYMTSATFDGALVSGRRAVEALLRDVAVARS